MTVTRFPAVVDIREVGRFAAAPMATGGQCEGVWVVPAHPSILFKRYTPQVCTQLDDAALDRLIAEPSRLTRVQRHLTESATSWPISRVTEDGRTVGVLLPRAPESFTVAWRSPTDTESPHRLTTLEIDLLAMPDSYLAQRKIPAQSAADRAAMCTVLAQIAALFEERGLVYADWSYANAFWRPAGHEVFLLDIDGCSFGPRSYVITPNFDDPKTPPGTKVDNYTDRYRAALLIARCLTKIRDVEPLFAALRVMSGPAPDTLRRMLVSDRRDTRPSLAELAAAFAGTTAAPAAARDPDATGVVDWVEWERPTRRSEPARAAAPTPNGSTPAPGQNVTAGNMALGCVVSLLILAAVIFGIYALIHWVF